MTKRLVQAADGLALLTLLVVLAILLTGGGELVVAGRQVRAHSVVNPIILFSFIAGWRVFTLGRWPLLGDARLTHSRLVAWARAFFGAVAGVGTWPAGRLRAVAAVMLGTSLSIKLANAAWQPGFFSGDDVEIHEMTLGLLFDEPWPIWNLRSATFPIGFIFPVQALLDSLGQDDIGLMVVAGRLVVALLSTGAALLLFVMAVRRWGPVTGMLALAFLASNGLHVAFGSTELPRSVAALFLVAALGLVLAGTSRSALLAGGAIGMAAVLRFSEAVFIVPAFVHLLADRRYRHAGLMVAAFILTAAIVQGASDWLYWGAPFASLNSVVDFTLVQGLSSRGYEPAWYYLTHLFSWTTPLVAALAVYGSRLEPRLALWLWLPILLLSAVPHKEPRYLVAVMPFLALVAARGANDVLARTASRAAAGRPTAGAAPLVAVVLVLVSFALEANRYRLPRSTDEVHVARALAVTQEPQSVAAESLWTFGGRLYLRGADRVDDIDPAALQAAGPFEQYMRSASVEWLLIRSATCERIGCAEVLARTGYRRGAAGSSRILTFTKAAVSGQDRSRAWSALRRRQ